MPRVCGVFLYVCVRAFRFEMPPRGILISLKGYTRSINSTRYRKLYNTRAQGILTVCTGDFFFFYVLPRSVCEHEMYARFEHYTVFHSH